MTVGQQDPPEIGLEESADATQDEPVGQDFLSAAADNVDVEESL